MSNINYRYDVIHTGKGYMYYELYTGKPRYYSYKGYSSDQKESNTRIFICVRIIVNRIIII
jgi:hypothetical protein